jgi:peptidoglycan/LPS O-acetylase OafA/YrhL
MTPTIPATAGSQSDAWRWTLTPGAFRIVLAFFVVIDHSLPLKLGPGAVALFFMLSGYWVNVMWHGEYEKTFAPWRVFMISRLWRLFPVYFLSLAAYVTVSLAISLPLPFEHAWPPFQKLHFYVSNLFILGLAEVPIGQRIVYPGWSLDIELQFYLVAPLIIAMVAPKKSFLTLVALAMVAVAGAGYFLVCDEGLLSASGPMPLYLGFFLIGLGAARYNWRPSGRTANASLLSAVAFLVAMIAFHKTRGLFLGGFLTTPISYYAPAANFLLAMLLVPYAMATVRISAKTRGGLIAAIDRHLSNLTYEVYLLHASVITGFNYLMTGIPRLYQMVFLPAAYGLIFVLACIVYRFYDQPIDKRRRAYVKQASRPLPDLTQRQSQPALTG